MKPTKLFSSHMISALVLTSASTALAQARAPRADVAVPATPAQTGPGPATPAVPVPETSAAAGTGSGASPSAAIEVAAPAPAAVVVVQAPAPMPTFVPVPVAPPAAIADVPAPLPMAGYDKAFFVQSADGINRLEIGGRVQPRFTYEYYPKAKDRGYFSANRAEVRIAGSALTKGLTYKFEADFGRGAIALKDFYVDYGILANAFHVRFGQFKKPYSRTAIVGSGNLETTERAITDRNFNYPGSGYSASGRDQGIMIHNNYDKSPTVEWALGLFNGVGERPWFAGTATGTVGADGRTVNSTETRTNNFTIVPNMFTPQIVARLGYNYGELKGYSEADLEGGPLRFGIAASGVLDLDADGNQGAASRHNSLLRGEVDAVVKVMGLGLTGGYYFSSLQTGKTFGIRHRGDRGFHVQGGFVIKDLVQPIVRFGQYNPTNTNNTDTELVMGLSFYIFKHSLKWQNDVSRIHHKASHSAEWLTRSQLQLNF